MKKISKLLVLVASLGLVLTGCNDSNSGSTNNNNSDGGNYDPSISETVAVTGVELNKTEVTLKVGETDTLIATVTPENATNKEVRWSSSNSSVVSVEDGVITAKKEGEVDITVTTKDGEKTAQAHVKVVDDGDPSNPGGGNEEPAEWTDAELALIEQYAYGIEIPCPGFKGDATLQLEEDEGYLYFEIGEVDELLVDSYADEFSLEVFEGGYNEDADEYYFETTVSTDAGDRFPAVEFYNYGYEGEETKFYFYVGDFYIYEWPAEELAECLELFEVTGEIPAFTGNFTKLYLDYSYLFFGSISVNVYSSEADLEAKYTADIGNKLTIQDERDEDGYLVAVNDTNDLTVSFKHYEEDGVLDIYIMLGEMEDDPSGSGSGEVDANALAVVTEVCDFLTGSAIIDQDFEYDDSDDSYYFNYVVTDSKGLEEDLTAVINSISEQFPDYLLIAEVEAITFDDGDKGYDAMFMYGDVVIDVYNWDDADNGPMIEVLIYSTGGTDIDDPIDDDPGTGSEGTGDVSVDGDVTKVSLDFTTMSDGAIFTSQTVGDVTFSCSKNDKNLNAKYYENGNALRVYSGCTFTFSVAGEHEITSIELTTDSKGDIELSSLTWTNATAEIDGNSCVVTPTNGLQDVSFKVNASKGNIRFTSISLSYK